MGRLNKVEYLFYFAMWLLPNVHGEKVVSPPIVHLSSKAVIQGTFHSSRAGSPYSAFRGIPYAKVVRRFEVSFNKL